MNSLPNFFIKKSDFQVLTKTHIQIFIVKSCQSQVSGNRSRIDVTEEFFYIGQVPPSSLSLTFHKPPRYIDLHNYFQKYESNSPLILYVIISNFYQELASYKLFNSLVLELQSASEFVQNYRNLKEIVREICDSTRTNDSKTNYVNANILKHEKSISSADLSRPITNNFNKNKGHKKLPSSVFTEIFKNFNCQKFSHRQEMSCLSVISFQQVRKLRNLNSKKNNETKSTTASSSAAVSVVSASISSKSYQKITIKKEDQTLRTKLTKVSKPAKAANVPIAEHRGNINEFVNEKSFRNSSEYGSEKELDLRGLNINPRKGLRGISKIPLMNKTRSLRMDSNSNNEINTFLELNKQTYSLQNPPKVPARAPRKKKSYSTKIGEYRTGVVSHYGTPKKVMSPILNRTTSLRSNVSSQEQESSRGSKEIDEFSSKIKTLKQELEKQKAINKANEATILKLKSSQTCLHKRLTTLSEENRTKKIDIIKLREDNRAKDEKIDILVGRLKYSQVMGHHLVREDQFITSKTDVTSGTGTSVEECFVQTGSETEELEV